MAGRLGAPNSGRLTTSAFLPSNGAIAPISEDAFFLIPLKTQSISDSFSAGDLGSVAWLSNTSLTDSFELTETQVTLLNTIIADLVESFDLNGALGSIQWIKPTEEGLSISDQPAGARLFDGTITSTTAMRDTVILATLMSVIDAVNLIDSITQLEFKAGAFVEELVAVQESISKTTTYKPAVTDTARLIAATIISYVVSASDTLNTADVVSAVRAIAVAEGLGLKDTLLPKQISARTYAESIRISDSLRNFFGGDVLDTIGMQSQPLPTKLAIQASTETVNIQDLPTYKLVFRLIANESVNVESIEQLSMLFNSTLSDGVEISAAYIAPGDNFTTWVVNTRNGAVTEYSNYNYNSFAKFGNKYIGASSDGLYELLGTTDDGEDIIATIKSGLLQMGATRFTLFKAAYFGIRGDGDFILRLITGDGDVYNYNLDANSMITSKVPLGKGLKARYFAFELISDENDFDLESIEFVPLVAQRRV